MADAFLGLEEVAKELQLPKEHVMELVKKGILRGFMDQKTYKFRRPDVDAYKKKLASSATGLSEGKDETSKIDLAEIESDSNVEDSDQTSVLAPADEKEDHSAKAEETPVFQFSEADLGLEEDKEPGIEEADQTSLMMPAEEAKTDAKEEKPAFDFAAQDDKNEDESGDSVLVADESESSIDILDVADESSSDSGSSSSHVDLSDETGTGENALAISDIEESPKAMAPVADKSAPSKPAAPPAKKLTPDTTVSDILGTADESSDEELESLDIEEVAAAESSQAGTILEESGDKTAGDVTDTVSIANEAETVGLAGADETTFTAGDAVETAGVSDVVADALSDVSAAEGTEISEAPSAEVAEAVAEAEVAAAPAEERMAAGTWETVIPSRCNGFLIAAIVMLAVTGIFTFCGAFSIDNGFTQAVKNTVMNMSWL